MNVELLLKVKTHILEEPRRLDMDQWKITRSPFIRPWDPPCGTVGCISGWATMLHNKTLPDDSRKFNPDQGEIPLNLTHEQRERLFFVNNWPYSFYGDYAKVKENNEKLDFIEVKKKLAEITARRIDHFIATNGLVEDYSF